jgi:glucose/arabinose dehydrogenase
MPSRSRERRTSRPFLSMAAVLALAAGVAVAPPASARIVGVRVAGDLRQSVAFTFDAQDRLWVVEKQVGSIYVQRLGSDRRRRFFKIPDVHGRGGQGLLGIALHPKFPDSPWVYAYATRDVGGNVVDQLLRIKSVDGKGRRMQVLLSSDAGSQDMHSGGSIMFGRDGMLYVYVGDATNAANAQRLRSPRGKILRLTPWGGIPDDNPIGGSRVFAYGFRNSFGMAFDPGSSRIWETDNGPECNDELNRVKPGRNFGWGPHATCSGAAPRNTNRDGPRPVLPERWFTPPIAPTGVAFCTGCQLGAKTEGALLFGDYVNGTLWRARLSPNRLRVAKLVQLARPSGQMLSLETGPGGRLYYSTYTGVWRLVRR